MGQSRPGEIEGAGEVGPNGAGKTTFAREFLPNEAGCPVPKDPQLLRLLDEVDAAIARVNKGTYSLRETCQEPIEPERLIANPLVQLCLDHMSPAQQRALELDLELASEIQTALLAQRSLRDAGWETAYHPVSGDYCDLLSHGGDLYFTVGDGTGKGVAASMLMAHLHASFRTLVSLELPLDQVVERASSMFCQSTLPSCFATLVCGKASSTGEIEVCNAGHVKRRSNLQI
ncbi:MAG: SpoIIE family protein phosphatase [bacterium]